MRKLFAIGLALFLGACALFDSGATPQDLQKQFIIACNSYSSALISVAGFRNKLSSQQVQMVNDSIQVVEPLCKGPLPSSPAEGQLALTTVATAVANLAAMGGSR